MSIHDKDNELMFENYNSNKLKENNNNQQQNYSHCADLIDDLDAKELTALINYLSLSKAHKGIRASIKNWRNKFKKL